MQNYLFIYLPTELVTMVVAISVIVITFPLLMSIGVAMAVIVLPRMVMSIGVAVTVRWPAPIAFSIAPALWAVFIVRDDPARFRIRRLPVVTSNPTVVVPLRHPESGHPHKGGFRWRRGCLDANRRRCYADIDRDLRRCWCHKRRRKGTENQSLFKHICLPYA
jgi:hypothetical protein